MKREAGWQLLAKSVAGIVITFLATILVLGIFVRLIDGGGSWLLTGHELADDQWYEAVRNTVATVALSVAGGAAYLAYRRQWTADQTQQTNAESKEISAEAQRTAAKAQMLNAKQYGLALARNKDDEIRGLRSRFSTAAEHLAHTSAAVRIAGVYAMSAVADDWATRNQPKEVQVCIDVLSGYLRLPYSAANGGNHSSKRVVSRSTVDGGLVEEHFEYRQNDREVRKTILRVIAAHLRSGADISWSDFTFDFRGAEFEDAELEFVVFNDRVYFGGAKFTGDTHFRGAIFRGFASFVNTTFTGTQALFQGTSFYRGSSFAQATFDTPTTLFVDVKFNGFASFRSAVFNKGCFFSQSAFKGSSTNFDSAKFRGDAACFRSADFHSKESTTFRSAAFDADHTYFTDATFRGGPADLSGAAFGGSLTLFKGSSFTSAETSFEQATFSADSTDFCNASFHSQETTFTKTHFGGKNASFQGAAFHFRTDFCGAVFDLQEHISFDDPRSWNDVTFDWDTNPSDMHECVRPRSWPPIVKPLNDTTNEVNTSND